MAKQTGVERLRDALEGKTKTVEAEAMEMSKQTLDHILKERQRPTLDQAVAMRRRFRIPISAWTGAG